MAFTLTDAAQDKANGTDIKPSLVLEIDGYADTFGLSSILKFTQFDDPGLFFDDGWFFDEPTEKRNHKSWISLDGTTTSISQQLQQDKGGATGVSSIQIALLDVSETISRLISPGFDLTDILGRRAYVYLGFQGTVFPRDYVILFTGIVDEVSSSGALITLNVAHPEQKKRQEIYKNIETELDGAITNSQTTITLKDVSNLIAPSLPELRTYVQINDEILEYTAIDSGLKQITGCVRGQLNTLAAAHDDEDSVTTVYRLQDAALDLALKIMLSGEDEYYLSAVPVTSFVRNIDGVSSVNSMYFSGVDVEAKYGLTIGDYVTTSGADEASNNVTLKQILSISVDDYGSGIVIGDVSFVLENDTPAVVSFKSQYNILPDGLGLGADQVDVAEFTRLRTLFSGSIPDYDFYIKDTINAKEFIDKEVLYPSNFFTLPKKGRISLGAFAPPLAVGTLPVIDSNSITKPESLSIKRSIGKYFYNTYIVKYDYDSIDDEPLAGFIRIDEDSKNQIPVGTKSIQIMSKGLRRSNENTLILGINSRRFLDRYRFAAEYINAQIFYGKGFNIDVGDVVLFGDSDLPFVDTRRGARGFTPRLCEVVDKRMDIKSGKIDLVMVDTNYLSDGRYGVFSPSSVVGVGSTTTKLVITDSYGTTAPEIERAKWVDYIGQRLLIHNSDWSTQYTTRLRGFITDYEMLIDTVAGAPTAGMIVEVVPYDATSAETDRVYKSLFCYFNPKLDVVTGVSQTEFTVSVGHAAKLYVGAQILLHNADYTSISPEVRVLEISGTTITTDLELGFTPDNTYDVELVGFLDEGPAYRWI